VLIAQVPEGLRPTGSLGEVRPQGLLIGEGVGLVAGAAGGDAIRRRNRRVRQGLTETEVFTPPERRGRPGGRSSPRRPGGRSRGRYGWAPRLRARRPPQGVSLRGARQLGPVGPAE
jgi:hypothetical protein